MSSAFAYSPGIGQMSFGFATCEPSPQPTSSPSTSLPAASPARTSASQGRESASTERVPVYGANSPDLWGRCGHGSSSSRTCPLCVLEGLIGYSAIWMRSATPAGRSWWVLDMSAHRTEGTESGSWPTARSRDWKGDGRNCLDRAVEWPTPKAVDGRAKGNGGSRKSPCLQQMMEWPTPTAQDYGSNQGGREGRIGKVRPSLRGLVKRTWTTPQAQDGQQDHFPPSSTHRDLLSAEVGRLGLESRSMDGKPPESSTPLQRLPPAMRGNLNHRWVAQLMGFPADWLDDIGGQP